MKIPKINICRIGVSTSIALLAAAAAIGGGLTCFLVVTGILIGMWTAIEAVVKYG